MADHQYLATDGMPRRQNLEQWQDVLAQIRETGPDLAGLAAEIAVALRAEIPETASEPFPEILALIAARLNSFVQSGMDTPTMVILIGLVSAELDPGPDILGSGHAECDHDRGWWPCLAGKRPGE